MDHDQSVSSKKMICICVNRALDFESYEEGRGTFAQNKSKKDCMKTLKKNLEGKWHVYIPSLTLNIPILLYATYYKIVRSPKL